MRPTSIHARLSVAGTVAVCLLLVPTAPSAAQTRYDGRWSVVVVTEQGACDVYRWEFDVSRGRVSPIRNTVATASGGISPRGQVKVTFTLSSDRLSATGAVSGMNGAGRWASPTRQCSGRWQADKRG
jgi:hypothetical protein